jgi:hypothetical protein
MKQRLSYSDGSASSSMSENRQITRRRSWTNTLGLAVIQVPRKDTHTPLLFDTTNVLGLHVLIGPARSRSPTTIPMTPGLFLSPPRSLHLLRRWPDFCPRPAPRAWTR